MRQKPDGTNNFPPETGSDYGRLLAVAHRLSLGVLNRIAELRQRYLLDLPVGTPERTPGSDESPAWDAPERRSQPRAPSPAVRVTASGTDVPTCAPSGPMRRTAPLAASSGYGTAAPREVGGDSVVSFSARRGSGEGLPASLPRLRPDAQLALTS